jgi:putative protease
MSLKDEDLSGRLEDLADAGVTSFKIEGRLRGPDYVRNVTAFYRKKLDEVLRNKRMKPSSSGKSDPGFDPDLAATFRRGGTILRLDGADRSVSAFSFGSPKSEGEPIGRVQSAESVWIDLGITISLRTGDGLCWTGPDGTDHGAFVNGVEGAKIRLSGKDRPLKGTLICRNKNAEFLKKLEAVKSVRNVMITVTVRTSADKVLILVEDEDGRSVSKELDRSEISEPKNEGQEKFWIRAFERTGGTIFRCSDVRFEGGPVRFYAVSRLNELRRFLLKEMELERERTRPRWKSSYRTDSSVRTEKWVKPEEGVLNRKAEAWYRNNGSPSVEWTYEAGTDIGSKALAVSRVCCFGDMGICGQGPVFYLRNDKGQRFRIETDCVDCGMRVFLDSKQG